jgi:hypothetical protein
MACSESKAIEWGMYVNAGVGDPRLPQNTGAGNDYASYTPATVKRLTDDPGVGNGVALPDDANCAVIVVEGAPIRIRVGATAATAAAGVLWFADTSHTFENQRSLLANISFIDATGTASRVTVLYGRLNV